MGSRRARIRPGRRGDDLSALVERAVALQSAGDYPGAVDAYEQAVRNSAKPEFLLHNLAAAYRSAGRLDDAAATFRRSLSLDPSNPSLRFAVGSGLLSLGYYAEAWPHYEARYDVPGLVQPKPRLPVPEWDGGELRGKSIAIFPEQGLGDQVQFARFVRDLRSLGAHVTLLCHPALERLFAASFDVDVVAAVGTAKFADPDVWTTVTSLPARLGVTCRSLDGEAYLTWEPTKQLKPRSQGQALRVGLAWRGSPHHRNDANRSLPREVADRLYGMPVEIVGLDPAESGAGDFADTAMLMKSLDLVVSVDTSVAHLAGALGVPCWILTPATDTDWRWLRERRDSPWYRSAKLYRQARPGTWDVVVDEVIGDVLEAARRLSA